MAPTPVFAEDSLIVELQRAGQRDSLTGPPRRTLRRKVLLVAAVLVMAAGVVGVTAWVRQPDPYTSSTVVPWHHPVVSADGRDVTVSYMGGGCGIESVRTIVQETARQVAVSVVEVTQHPGDGRLCLGMGISRKAVAQLAQPLGTRTLVDGRCSQPASLKAPWIRCPSHRAN